MICPRCQQDVTPSPLGFTWWGGVLGPRLLSHVECPACRHRFNGKTGRDNTAAIVVYSVVIGAIAFVLIYAIFTR
jgi:hypothetical protein